MEHDFWHERWRLNKIGFHEPAVHPMLERHWPPVADMDDESDGAFDDVLIPLCGKSLDMHWLAQRGHSVVGCELSELAVREFFADRSVAVTPHGALQRFSDPPYRVWCGDFFELSAAHEPPATLAYDRAALVALPEPLRTRYAAHLLSLLAPGANVLLITLQYDDPKLVGPPFNVSLDEIERLFGGACKIEHLEQSPTTVKGQFEVLQTASWLHKREDCYDGHAFAT